jgi:hypothetical protein
MIEDEVMEYTVFLGNRSYDEQVDLMLEFVDENIFNSNIYSLKE